MKPKQSMLDRAAANLQNRRHAPANSTTGYLGVSLGKKRRYRASIKANGRNVHLGYFKTAEEAHAAYLVAKRQMHQGCTI